MELSEIHEKCKLDPELIQVSKLIVSGQPDRQTHVSELARPYWNFRDELSVLDGVLLKGNCIVVPKLMRTDVLKQIHEGHIGVRPRTSVYLPGGNEDFSDLVGQCETCQLSQPRNQKEPLVSVEIPSTPWTKLGVDLFELNERHYLVLVDYMSKFPIMRQIDNETSSMVIHSIKCVLSEFGNIIEMISDNSPCFRSSEFANFATNYLFVHTTISPNLHQSNGQVRRCTRTIMGLIKKNFSDPWMS